MPALTLYFDSKCPLCKREMQRLGRWDRNGRLAFIDMSQADFDPAPLGVTLAAMDAELHAVNAEGGLLVGTDAILEAYTLVGRSWLVWPLRVPVLRPMLAKAYRSLARNRYRVSRWFGYGSAHRACDGDRCQLFTGEHHGT
ncbi:thiol-disulfide oxidoreductase DCC family protein [Pseudoduganella sp. OTU4001]|uniref:thiol-disulfide oxidoreductase DCC family protein n=1 Tax=Pseudoduganella sp. OTU4001 TaxID=3043854 RepID=UPI00313C9B10